MHISDYIITIFVCVGIVAALAPIFIMAKNYFKMQKYINSSDDDGYMNEEKEGYIKTTGYFTGKKQLAKKVTRTGNLYSKDYLEYEIHYRAEDQERNVWYSFYPAPDPAYDIEGMEVKLQYDPNKSWRFEILDIYYPED